MLSKRALLYAASALIIMAVAALFMRNPWTTGPLAVNDNPESQPGGAVSTTTRP